MRGSGKKGDPQGKVIFLLLSFRLSQRNGHLKTAACDYPRENAESSSWKVLGRFVGSLQAVHGCGRLGFVSTRTPPSFPAFGRFSRDTNKKPTIWVRSPYFEKHTMGKKNGRPPRSRSEDAGFAHSTQQVAQSKWTS